MVSLIPVSKPEAMNPLRLGVLMGPVMERAWFTNNGPSLRRFESRVADRLRVPYFRALANGTLALEAAISMKFKPGDVIAVPSFTFVAAASAIVRCGCVPLFLDVEPQSWTMDYRHVQDNITRIAGIVVANTFGAKPSDDYAKSQLTVIYDNAEGFGNHTGIFGNVDVYSFHATKIVSCGEGGGIACFKDDVAYIENWRDFGFDGSGDTVSVGTNAKMSEFHAVLGTRSLEHEAWQIAQRLELFKWYKDRLHGVVAFQSVTVPHNLVILTDRRERVEKALYYGGIDSRRYFHPIHQMAPYKDYPQGPLSVTDALGATALALPFWAGMRESTVDKICSVVREAHK